MGDIIIATMPRLVAGAICFPLLHACSRASGMQTGNARRLCCSSHLQCCRYLPHIHRETRHFSILYSAACCAPAVAARNALPECSVAAAADKRLAGGRPHAALRARARFLLHLPPAHRTHRTRGETGGHGGRQAPALFLAAAFRATSQACVKRPVGLAVSVLFSPFGARRWNMATLCTAPSVVSARHNAL